MKYNRNKLRGKFVKVTEGNRRELIDFFKGATVNNDLPYSVGACYGFSDDLDLVYFGSVSETLGYGYDVITLAQAGNLTKSKPEPKLDKNLMRGCYIKLTEENKESVRVFFTELYHNNLPRLKFSCTGWY